MSLRRTMAGLASLHLFFRVDCIAFCEGGDSINEADVLAGLGDEGTLDVSFWKNIADLLNAKRSYHFKSVGSKSTLKSIAADVATLGINTIIVCLDRDYDWHCGKQLNHPNVIYTFGYSWESDVVCPIGLEHLFFRMFPRTASSKKTFDKGIKHISRVSSQLVRWCEIEITLSSRNMELIFVRDRPPTAAIDLSGSALPTLSLVGIRANLTRIGFKRGPKPLVCIQKDEVFRHVWGKLASRLYYHLFVRLVVRSDAGMRVSYDLFMRLMISEMVEIVKSGLSPDKYAYYQTLSGTLT
jgi:hypothetical protein